MRDLRLATAQTAGNMKFVKTYLSSPMNTPSEEALMLPVPETTCLAVSSWRKYIAIGQIR